MTCAHALPIKVNLYDRLFSVPEPDRNKDDDPGEYINQDSLKVTKGYIEPSVLKSPFGSRYQFQRLGYFILYSKNDKGQLVFNKTVGLRDTWQKI